MTIDPGTMSIDEANRTLNEMSVTHHITFESIMKACATRTVTREMNKFIDAVTVIKRNRVHA